jgi:photosystem II stability/assembly factor-like uncharacterized protein
VRRRRQPPWRPVSARSLWLLVAMPALLIGQGNPSWASTASSGWLQNGPPGALIEALAAAPSDPSILYAVSTTLVYRSADSGRSWKVVNSDGAGLGPAGAAISWQDPDVVYISNRDVEKSVDGGATWTVIDNGLPESPSTQYLAVDPADDQTVYAATAYGVYKTTDGANWTLSLGVEASTLAIDPENPQVVFAGVNLGLYMTVDGGSNWIRSDAGLPDGPDAVGVDPHDDQRVFATVDGFVYRSLDGGTSWAESDVGLDGALAYSLAVSSTETNTVYLATLSRKTPRGVFKSTDGGDTRTRVSVAATASILVSATSPGLLYAATGDDLGVERSVDGGVHWSLASSGMLETYVAALAADPTNPSVAYASIAATSGVFKTTDEGRTWTPAGRGLPLVTLSLAVSPSNPSIVYAGEEQDYYLDENAGVYRSEDGGLTWRRANGGISDAWLVESLAVSPTDPNVVFAGLGYPCDECLDGAVAKTADGGRTWKLQGGLDRSLYTSVAIAPSNADVVYAASATRGALYRSVDGGRTWTLENNGLTFVSVEDLAVDPADPSIVYAADGLIYRTADAGAHWSRVGPSGPQNAQTLETDPATSGSLCAGDFYLGAFCSSDYGVTWVQVQGLEEEVTDVAIGPRKVLYAGTAVEGVAVFGS